MRLLQFMQTNAISDISNRVQNEIERKTQQQRKREENSAQTPWQIVNWVVEAMSPIQQQFLTLLLIKLCCCCAIPCNSYHLKHAQVLSKLWAIQIVSTETCQSVMLICRLGDTGRYAMYCSFRISF